MTKKPFEAPVTAIEEAIRDRMDAIVGPSDSPGLSGELRGNNPWPEDSDYGKFWRRGYEAGCSDTTARLLPAFTKTTDTGEEK